MQLGRDELVSAYRTMSRIRAFEERLHQEFASGTIPGFVHLYAGQEASAVGVCMNLDDRDAIASTHRGHGHSIAKGCDIPAMMKEVYGKEGGLCAGKGGSMHIADLSKGMMGANGIVGGGPPLVCGAALAAKYNKTGGVAVSFLGDGASNQGTTLESLNFASVLKLPMIFWFENNGYAESTSSNWSIACGDLINRAGAFGMPGIQVDGTDFFETYRAGQEAVERARKGEGPTLVEVKLARWYGHFEGDPQSYRADGEVDALRTEKDPLKIFRRKVTEAALLEAAQLDGIDADAQAEIEQAVKDAVAAPMPSLDTLTTDVYISY